MANFLTCSEDNLSKDKIFTIASTMIVMLIVHLICNGIIYRVEYCHYHVLRNLGLDFEILYLLFLTTGKPEVNKVPELYLMIIEG